MLAVIGLLAGLVVLVGSGAVMVSGASGIAERHGISPAIVGLTILAFGTSAPELAVNVIGALSGETELAFGNVVGSNLANLGLILGIATLFHSIEMQGQIVRREVPLLLLATLMIVVLALDPMLRGEPARLDRSDGLVLYLLFGIFMYIAVMDVVQQRNVDPLLTELEQRPAVARKRPALLDVGYVVGGSAGLFIGGQMTITNGVSLAEVMQIPTAIVGLFVVAIGTSMPELVTTVLAAIRREPDLAVGNVVGSNLFNNLFVLPASAVLTPVTVPGGGLPDLLVSLLFAAALIPIFWFGRARLGRKSGLLLLATYLAYAASRMF